MIKGYFDRSPEFTGVRIFLIDDERRCHYVLKVERKENPTPGLRVDSTFIDNDNLELLVGLSEALQQGGYIPKSAVDAELLATKFHLEDMRNLVFEGTVK